MKTHQKTTTRKPLAQRVQKSGTPGETGKLSHAEISKLLIQAKEAWGYQLACKSIQPDAKFDDFRRDQVQAAVGIPGLSKLNRSHWRTVSAHFLTLAGCEDEAFELLNRTGQKTYRGTKPGDTWETAEAYVAHIRQALADHLTADLRPGMTRIEPGWLLTAARQRTGKPTLSMDTLAERLNPQTLHGLLSHLRNHIALREGREGLADLARRSVRTYPSKPDPSQIDDPF
jgi:hypothetical protein